MILSTSASTQHQVNHPFELPVGGAIAAMGEDYGRYKT